MLRYQTNFNVEVTYWNKSNSIFSFFIIDNWYSIILKYFHFFPGIVSFQYIYVIIYNFIFIFSF